ncbi:MAG TPA: hypothetical protein VD930_04450 [Gemmatimonadales bacterium]|nr:hypothetical protein [Gemmatimonadales bacterium]
MPTLRYLSAPARWQRLVPALLSALVAAGPTVAAQQRAAPFETLDLSIELLADIHQSRLQRDWSTGPVLGIGLALPFYLGNVELGVQLARPSARQASLPDFRSLFVYAGWSGTRELGRRLRAEAGVRAGIVGLSFHGDNIAEGRERESEPAVTARGALRWTPRAPWFTEAAVAWHSVFTEPRMEQLFLSAAVGRRFRTPTWLRDFLD